MSKKTYETLKESLCYELDGLTKRGDVNKDTLDSMYKLIKSIKGLEQLIEMEDGGSKDGGYSMGYYGTSMRGPYMGRSYDGNNSYNSYNRSYDMSNAANTSQESYDMSNAGEMSNGRNSYNTSNRSYDSSYEASNARAGRDGDGDGRYSEDYSSARGRDARGRYTSRDKGYSRHSAKDRVIKRLEDMLDESNSNSEQIAIMKCIEELQD